MTSDFSIDSVRHTAPMGRVKASGIEKEIYVSPEYGALLKDDKRLLEEYSGNKFDFPPAPGQAVPRALIFIAQARGAEHSAGNGYSDLGSLIGHINSTHRRMTGKDAIDKEFMSFVADRSHVGGGTWSSYFENKRASVVSH